MASRAVAPRQLVGGGRFQSRSTARTDSADSAGQRRRPPATGDRGANWSEPLALQATRRGVRPAAPHTRSGSLGQLEMIDLAPGHPTLGEKAIGRHPFVFDYQSNPPEAPQENGDGWPEDRIERHSRTQALPEENGHSEDDRQDRGEEASNRGEGRPVDSVHPHAAEMFQVLGGAVEAAMSGLPNSQLAVLPGTTRMTILTRADFAAFGHPTVPRRTYARGHVMAMQLVITCGGY